MPGTHGHEGLDHDTNASDVRSHAVMQRHQEVREGTDKEVMSPGGLRINYAGAGWRGSLPFRRLSVGKALIVFRALRSARRRS